MYADRPKEAALGFVGTALCVCLTALRAGPPFSWGVTSGGPPGGRSLSKDGTRADSANDFSVELVVCITQEI